MNKYELALVLSPALDEEGRAAEVAKVQATLERFGAKKKKSKRLMTGAKESSLTKSQR